jgi:DNA-binding CsgD family transcriptional regulator
MPGDRGVGDRVNERIIGREHELADLERFVTDHRDGAVALSIEGDSGVGKSILWRHAVELGNVDGAVVTSRPSRADSTSSFTALTDLLEPLLPDGAPTLSAPRERALAVALRRAEPKVPPDPCSVAFAALDVIKRASEIQPLLIAIDDATWMDRPSARALRFACRRLERAPVAIVMTARSEGSEDAAIPLDAGGPDVRRMRLGPLGVGAVHRLLSERLDLVLPRHVLLRLHAQAAGNPFYSLEIARALMRRGMDLGPQEILPMPASLQDLMGERLEQLSSAATRICLYAAMLSRPTFRTLSAIEDPAAPLSALDECVDGGIVEWRDEAVEFIHPLVASTICSRSPLSLRRDIHRRLGQVVRDPEERGRHVALAATGPDADAASIVEDAARRAVLRGACGSAAELFDLARRLTPLSDEKDAARRADEAIDHHIYAGDMAAAERLANEMLEAEPAAQRRGALLVRLAAIRWRESDWLAAESLLHEAEASEPDDGLASVIQQELGWVRMHQGDMEEAIRRGRESLALARRSGQPALIANALVRLAGYEFITGKGVAPDLVPTVDALQRESRGYHGLIQVFDAGVGLSYILKTSDDLDGARERLREHYREAAERGNESALPFILSHLSELEYWAGNWDRSQSYADEGLRIAVLTEQPTMTPVLNYSIALLLAARGSVDQARPIAEEALAGAEGNVPVMLMASSVLGFLDLSIGDFAAAHARLGALAQSMLAMGAGEPGCVRFLADEVDAVVSLGDIEAASSITDYLEERGRTLDRPWALATGARCRALVEAASGRLEESEASLERALRAHDRLGMPFELGRTLLVAGTVHRRGKHKRKSRESLEHAIAIFEDLGASLWLEKARSELGRVGVRARAALDLTPTEERVAELVVAGHTNREVADILYMSVRTVESNLTRSYRKLNVRSRTELATKVPAKKAAS